MDASVVGEGLVAPVYAAYEYISVLWLMSNENI